MFVIKKKLDLAEFGWEGCEIVFSSLNYDELLEIQSKYAKADPSDQLTYGGILDFIKSKFISGTAKDDNDKVVEIDKDDIGKLPFEIVLAVITLLTGQTPDPKV